jgi:transcriptional regulator with GAF, ATPase, and Fis domain
LKATAGNISQAARQLNITPRMARYQLRKLGIDYRQFFNKA